MILAIDYGGAIAKVLKVDGAGSAPLMEFPLGFKTRPHLNIPDSLRLIIKTASQGGQVEAVYASGEIASVELKEILTATPLDPVEVLNSLAMPLADVGVNFAYVLGKAWRGELDPAEVAAWLPFNAKDSEVANFLGNKNLYPQMIPTTPQELQMEQAIARAKIKRTANYELPATNSIIATGGVFSKAPEPWQTVAVLLDTLEPEGLLDIYLDQTQALPAIGTLAHFEKQLAQELLDQHSPTLLAATFSIGESVKLALDLDLPEPQELEIGTETVAVFPLNEGRNARVSFTGQSQAGEFETTGGRIGLVIDTRRRPLKLPKDENQRVESLQGWYKSLSRETKKL